MCSEIYLREGPHSLIDANAFPGRHATCSGCRSCLTLCNIEAYYTFNEIMENSFHVNEYITPEGLNNPFHQKIICIGLLFS